MFKLVSGKMLNSRRLPVHPSQSCRPMHACTFPRQAAMAASAWHRTASITSISIDFMSKISLPCSRGWQARREPARPTCRCGRAHHRALGQAAEFQGQPDRGADPRQPAEDHAGRCGCVQDAGMLPRLPSCDPPPMLYMLPTLHTLVRPPVLVLPSSAQTIGA